MDMKLVFDKGNNVYNFMVFTEEEFRKIVEYRKDRFPDYKFLYDRETLEKVLGYETSFWVPEYFTTYEPGMNVVVTIGEQTVSASLEQARVEHVRPSEAEPAEEDDDGIVTAVVGCHGREIIEYSWRDVEGPFDISRLTVRVREQAQTSPDGAPIRVIDEILYDGRPCDATSLDDKGVEWLWEPSFFCEREPDFEY